MNDEYRFRLLDADQGAPREMTMVCLDDEAAILLGERFAQGVDVEVWARDRLVGRVPSLGPSPGVAASAEAAPRRRRFKPFWSGAWRRAAPRP